MKMKNEDRNEDEFSLFYWWKSGVVWKMTILYVDSGRFLKSGQTHVSVRNDVSMIHGV